jgi:monothiol glutaredoxin
MSILKVLKGGKGSDEGSRDVQKEIAEMVAANELVLFMKGTPQAPRCGFSARAVEVLQQYRPTFFAFDVFTDNDIREGIKQFANWPTIPQAYFKGEFIGGSDILLEMHQSGELGAILSQAGSS